MSFSAAQQTVTTTAARIWPPTDAFARGGSLAIKNTSSNTIWIGAAGVTTANGYPIAAGEAVGIDLGPSDALFAIASAASTIAILAGSIF